MNDKEYNNFIKLLLIICGTIVVTLCLFLYMGDDGMKNEIKSFVSNNWCKIFIIIVLIIAVGVCCFPCKKKYAIGRRIFLCEFSNGIAIVRKSNEKNCESYTILHYDDLKNGLSAIQDNDKVYIYDKKIEITEEIKIPNAKKFTLQFIETEFNIINQQSSKSKD